MAIDVKKLEKGSVYEAQAPLESVLADVAEIDKAEQQFAQARKAKVRLGFLSLGIGVLGLAVIPGCRAAPPATARPAAS